jgi:UDP-N-acetylglucosamine 2-epimerase (non-hydrolysing)
MEAGEVERVVSVSRPKVLFIFGTRPEAIKLAPVIRCFRRFPTDFKTRVCVTAQHREMLDQVLAAFEIVPDYDLDLMHPDQSLFQSTSTIMAGLEPIMRREQPDIVLVQGDTTTTFCGALAGFYGHARVGHVEAGLRTRDLSQPFPEELNRVLVTRLSSLHFAPTAGAADNLRREGVEADCVWVTGNTGIDALLQVSNSLREGLLPTEEWPWLIPEKKLIIVTAHRRESFGAGFEHMCRAIRCLASRPDVQIVYPVHPNPNVRGPVERSLAGVENIRLIEPLAYVSFVDLMSRAYLLLTDSGGIQEEAPSLMKPVLVMRDTTERPDAMRAGSARLVGTEEDSIVPQVIMLLDDEQEYRRMIAHYNPYGDGHASERIREAVLSKCRGTGP